MMILDSGLLFWATLYTVFFPDTQTFDQSTPLAPCFKTWDISLPTTPLIDDPARYHDTTLMQTIMPTCCCIWRVRPIYSIFTAPHLLTVSSIPCWRQKHLCRRHGSRRRGLFADGAATN